jgi:glycosyltransferase involved in cell wall biosynthesis
VTAADPFLLILKNGPIYAIDDYVGYQLEVLSRRFQGELWVTGSFDADERIGRFRLRVIKEGGSRLLFFWHYYRALLARARELDREISGPKVLVTYDPFRNGLMGRMIKARVGWPLIVEVNGAFGNPDNFADSVGWFGRGIKPRLLRAVGRYTVSKADGIRLLYNEQLQNFAEVPPNAVVRQYFDAVPIERFAPAPEEQLVLHLGFPFRRKGVDILLAAFEKLRAEFPSWRLAIIGHDLLRHVPGIPDGVSIMKAVNNREAAEWISRCAVLVLASRSEAMGRVLIEAAAAAKPRIAARVDGTYTVVSHGSDGLLFEKASVPALTETLRNLMSNSDLRRQMGATARERALREFNGDSYASHVADLVSAVLSRR